MKLFIDTAMIEEIRAAAEMGVLDGVTTNPSLVAQTGRPFRSVVEEICEAVDGPVSLEVVGTDAETMITEGRELARIAPNVVVKIPIIREGMKAIRTLAGEGIKVNCTLIFQAMQAMLAAKAGAAYVSPFVGRLDDVSQDGMDLIGDIVTIFDNYAFDTEVLVASVRNPLHLLESARMGAHVATVPFGVIDKLLNHPLTDKGLAAFLKDWEKVPKG